MMPFVRGMGIEYTELIFPFANFQGQINKNYSIAAFTLLALMQLIFSPRMAARLK